MNEVSGNRAFYNNEVRAEIREFVEARVGTDHADFDALWQDLENAARQYERSLERIGPKTTPKDTLDRLDGCIDAIRTLTGENGLLSPYMLAQDFISDRGFISKRESPARLAGLVRNLQSVEAELVEDVETLRELAAGKRPHMYGPYDHRQLLQSNMLKIGHRLLGSQIGGDDGPLMSFMQLVLRPLLGSATPNEATMRTFARRSVSVELIFTLS